MKIQRKWGVPLELELPYGENDDPLFDALSRAIEREWSDRQPRRSSPGRKGTPGAIAWLEVVSYRVISHMLDQGLSEIFDRRLMRFKRRTIQGEGVRLYQRGLFAIFAHVPRGISSSVQERVAKRCWHAYRHYVPDQFYAGFFKQIGSAGLIQRAVGNEIEPDFEEWIIQQRCKETDAQDFRPRYPTSLEEEVARRMEKRADAKEPWKDDEDDDWED